MDTTTGEASHLQSAYLLSEMGSCHLVTGNADRPWVKLQAQSRGLIAIDDKIPNVLQHETSVSNARFLSTVDKISLPVFMQRGQLRSCILPILSRIEVSVVESILFEGYHLAQKKV